MKKNKLNLSDFQAEQKEWSLYNFGEHPSWHPLLGIMEEVGELAHAHLKQVQGIRTNEEHTEAKRDAIGDIIVYLSDYCTSEGIDFEKAVQETWDEVRQRDWKGNAENGKNIGIR